MKPRWRRTMAFLLAAAMVFSLSGGPVYAAAAGEAECICDGDPCTAEAFNENCPVCGLEGADLTQCAQYVAPAAQSEAPQGDGEPAGGSEPDGDPSDPTGEGEPAGNPSDPTGDGEPAGDPSDPTGDGEPAGDPSDPTGDGEPAGDPSDPTGEGEPAGDPSDPAGEGEPAGDPSDPTGESDPPAEPVCVCEGLPKCAEGAMNACDFCAAALGECLGAEAPEVPSCVCGGLPKCAEGAVNAECALCAGDPAGCLGEAPALPRVVLGWEWVDPEEFLALDEERGVWVLALPGVSLEHQADLDTLTQMLPGSLRAVLEEGAEELPLSGWTCEAYQQNGEGNWPLTGNYIFIPKLPEGYVLSDQAAALEVTVELGGASLFANATDVPYLDKDGNEQTCPTATVAESNTDPVTWNAGWYYVQTDTEITGRITATGDVHLILGDKATLTASSGISVTEGNSLTIYAQSADESTMGALAATAPQLSSAESGGSPNAGIGGEETNPNAGAITINGGRITATGGNNTSSGTTRSGGAGIGGAFGGAGGNVTINGGGVAAQGGSFGTRTGGAGIGGGGNFSFDGEVVTGGAGGSLTINGGTVTATGGVGAAGIGGGGGGDTYITGGAGGTVIINDGTVEATGGSPSGLSNFSGAGIGGGAGDSNGGDGGEVIISGGTVTATGGAQSAGIGGGVGETGGDGGDVTINGGVVNATGGVGGSDVCPLGGPGIGGGVTNSTDEPGGAGADVTINGGIVTAAGGKSGYSGNPDGVGIGGGSTLLGTAGGAGGSVTISGGTVIATGGFGIGGGLGPHNFGDFSKITSEAAVLTSGGSGTAWILSDNLHAKTENFTSGVLFNGNSGKVYGNYTLDGSREVPSGRTLTIPATAGLTVEAGAALTVAGTLTNSGALTLGNTDALSGSGALSGDGSFTVSGDPVGSMIVVPQGLVYTGIDLTNSAKAAIELNVGTGGTTQIMGQTFTVNASADGWTFAGFSPVQVLNAGTYTVSYTKGDKTIQNTFTVAQSGSAIPTGGIETYIGNGKQSDTFTYGEIIVVMAQAPQPTGIAPMTFAAPTANQMAVFKGDTQVSDAVDAAAGFYFMEIDTTDKTLALGENILTAKYVGNSNMAGTAVDFTVTVQPKPLTAAVDSAASKAYDGSNSFTGVALTLTGVVSGDTVTATAAGNTVDANVGTNKTFTATSVTLEGADKDYYTLAADKVSGSVAITPKTVSSPSITMDGDSFEYTGSAIEPGVIVKDGETQIPTSEYDVSYSGNTNAGQATVTITDKTGGNYDLSTATKTFEITKPSLTTATVTLEIPEGGYTYDGQPHTPGITVVKNGITVDSSEYDVTYSNSNGGTAGGNVNAGTVTVTVTAKADGNYSGSNSTATFEVSKRSVLAVVTAQDKTYDGKLNAVVTAEVTEGLVGTDSITITGLTGTFVDANAGTKKVVRVNSEGAVISGGDNYHVIIPGTTSANILKDMSATPPAAGEGYDINYLAETIYVGRGYEVYTAETGGTQILSGWVSDYLGQTLYVRKLEDNNHAASGWTAFTVAARPAAPSLTKTDETLKGQKNGELQGVTTSMEYSTNNGASWTRCSGTTVTGLAGGTTVQVREKATQTTFSGEIATLTIERGAGITVTYQQGSQTATNIPAQLTGLSYDTKITKPADPVAENTDFVFVGWYKGEKEWDFDTDTLVEENVVLTAQWKEKQAVTITGVNTATDLIYNGQPQKGYTGTPTSDYKGEYEITYSADPVQAGNYTVTFKVPSGDQTYKGSLTLDFTISQRVVGLQWTAPDLGYDGTAKEPTVEATGLVEGDTVEVEIETQDNHTNAGDTFTFTAVSLNNPNYKLPNEGLTSGKYTVQAHALVKNDFQVDLSDKVYTGEEFKPAVASVKDYITESDFEVAYEDNLNAGTASITITGKGNCAGEVVLTFTINRATPEVTWPDDLVGEAGRLLSSVTLGDGFTWENGNQEIAYGGKEYTMIYTPDDAVNYKILKEDIAVQGNDVTAPTAEITVSTHKWNAFLNNITFDLFFKATQSVTITASDTQSGLATIQYFLSDSEKTLDQVKAHTAWTTYSRPFNVNPDGKFIVYAKATDNAGNTLYLSSDGLILDATAPAISGIENGKTYLEQATFTVTDANLNTVTVDGKTVTLTDGKYTITADNKDHIVTATDKAGNSVAYRITVLEVYTVTYKADGKVVDTQKVPYGQNADAPEVPKKSGYSGKWDHDGKNITEDTTITAKYTKSWWDNPKTGDAIRGVLVVLVVSATALAGIGGYAFWQKKRKK